ncbi:MAG: hypothetical protein AVDCRST_MAG22-1418, partial [uncultured Rubrobacteraceae bacterium]
AGTGPARLARRGTLRPGGHRRGGCVRPVPRLCGGLGHKGGGGGQPLCHGLYRPLGHAARGSQRGPRRLEGLRPPLLGHRALDAARGGGKPSLPGGRRSGRLRRLAAGPRIPHGPRPIAEPGERAQYPSRVRAPRRRRGRGAGRARGYRGRSAHDPAHGARLRPALQGRRGDQPRDQLSYRRGRRRRVRGIGPRATGELADLDLRRRARGLARRGGEGPRAGAPYPARLRPPPGLYRGADPARRRERTI